MSITVMILSGGRSRRFGGVHKPGVSLGGQTVISRILGTVRAAVPDAKVWVAGTLEGLTAAEAESVGNVREEPEFSGPLAGIDAAAQAMGESEVTLILAGDMPLVPAVHLRELIAACRASGLPAAGADDRGKLQFLCAAWPTALLRRRLAEIGRTQDRAVKLLFDGLEVAPVDVDPSTIVDFDTREEYERIRGKLESADPDAGTESVGADAPRGGRPVPDQVLRMRDRAAAELPAGASMSDAEVAAVLEFASHIKHSDSSLSPVVAAFLAGRLHAAGSDGASVTEVLAEVERILTRSRD